MSCTTPSGAAPAAKRKRTEDGREAAEPAITRSDVWLDDGNIILQAERTQFKFYKGLLARHSQVFADMLAVVPHSQEASDGASAESCPVVELTDAAQDVRFMLLWLLEPRSYTAKPTITSVISAMRMGHKYMVVPLWEDVVERLHFEFPKTLEGYYAQTQRWASIHCDGGDDAVLRLADVVRGVGLDTILPMLYYRIILTCSIDTIPNGSATLEDDGSSSESQSLIGPHTCITLLKARAKITARFRQNFMAWSWTEADDCVQSKDCAQATKDFQNRTWTIQSPSPKHFAEDEAALHLFHPWKTIRPKLRCPCDRCMMAMEDVYIEYQRATWAELPTFFGLPVWENLRDYSVV
ncbi:uncharacterized protein SCHCODRAFT_02745317 [Schizophyllum commune H4-8]|nr:uncharacterized protein SCHCODRAFT_02745317 [Schizophyllum commune H4-8]KAI5896293.1 hypothetical protein SCHCODRAFT_02745317 [Schizophyllum commune H4-8]